MSWMDDETRRQILFQDSIQKALGSADIFKQARQIVEFHDSTRQAREMAALYTPPAHVRDFVADQARESMEKYSLLAPSISHDIRQIESLANHLERHRDAALYWERHQQHYTIPETVRLQQLATDIFKRDAFQLSHSNMVAVMNRMNTPWLDTRDPLGSVGSFVAIQAIGFGANHTPFEPEFMTTLRGQLGDWRDVDSAPPAIFEDAAERSKFYIARGFRTELVDFTPEALEEIVENAGLGADNEENFEWHERTYAHVIRIERKLRKHVNAVMTKAFGENWISFDGNLVDRCKATKERRLADGEPERPHLVYYAELSDLCSIMERKNHFPLFKPIFKRKEAMQETFKRVVPARHAVVHDGIVTPIDFLTVMTDHMNIHQGLKRQEE